MRSRWWHAVSVILVIMLTASVAQAGYLPPSSDGIRNALFVPMEYSSYDGNPVQYSAADFSKYVVHADPVTGAKDFLFREFIFAPLFTAPYQTSPRQQRSFSPVPSGGAQDAGIKSDWDHYLNELFLTGYNLPALYDMASRSGNGYQDTTLDVWISLPYPDPKSRFNGTSAQPFWCNNANRVAAVQTWVNQFLERWNASGYSGRLRLRGFNQLAEDVIYWNPSTNPCSGGANHLDQNWYGQINDYIHNRGLGLKVMWVPYYLSGYATGWASLHFDFAVLQPNRYFLEVTNSVPTGQRVCECQWSQVFSKAQPGGMGVEMELDGGIWWNPIPNDPYYSGPVRRDRFKEYLDQGYQNGFMNQAAHVWFDDAKGMLGLFRTDRNYTYVYDEIYRFSKGTYKSLQASGSPAVRPSSMNLFVGQTQRAELWATFLDGSTGAVPAAWETSNPSVASVDPRSGLIQGLRAGDATITTTYWDRSYSTVVHVTAAPTMTGLTISPGSATFNVGASQSFTATARYSDGSSTNVTAQAGWTSSTPSVTTVSGGTARGVAAGRATITATYGGYTSTAAVTVNASRTLTGITLSPSTASISVGATQAYTVTARYSDGSSTDVTAQAAWNSSPTSVATVSGGIARGVAPGTAYLATSYGGFLGTATLTVTAPPPGSSWQTAIPLSGTVSGNVTLQQAVYYRLNATAGTAYTVTLTPSTDDADLYLHADDTNHTTLRQSIRGGTTPDQVTYTASANGILYVRVYGYRATGYTLSLSGGR